MAKDFKLKQSKRHIIFGWIIPACLILVIAACGWYFYNWYTTGRELPIALLPVAGGDSEVSEDDVTPAQKLEYQVPADHPRYLSIPSLGVINARVESVGVDKDNVLGSPDNINDTAWYNQSATPGSGGAVLIDGHNGGTRRDGVFVKLGTLKEGDEIILERGDGKKFTYSVVSNVSMSIDDANKTGMKDMMNSAKSGVEGLNLITCDGVYIPATKEFNKRIMLKAVLVQS